VEWKEVEGNLMISDEQIAKVVRRLERMNPDFHALPDGRGIFLGNGIPYSRDEAIRSRDLVALLNELLEHRSAMKPAL
jgi:hypothetical protein